MAPLHPYCCTSSFSFIPQVSPNTKPTGIINKYINIQKLISDRTCQERTITNEIFSKKTTLISQMQKNTQN